LAEEKWERSTDDAATQRLFSAPRYLLSYSIFFFNCRRLCFCTSFKFSIKRLPLFFVKRNSTVKKLLLDAFLYNKFFPKKL